MKHLSWFLAITLVLCACQREDPARRFTWPAPEDSLAAGLLDSLQVTEIGLRLADSPDEINRQLWRTFANRDPAKRQERLVTEGQIFPVGAFIAKRHREKIWVIPCLWESGRPHDAAGRPQPMKTHHIQIWAFHIQSGQEVGHVSCKYSHVSCK